MDELINKNDKRMDYQITEEGSLGLLAIGDLGIRMWKQYKKELQKQNEKS